MHNVLAICRRDLAAWFAAPLAWLVMAAWLILINIIFYWFGLEQARGQSGVTNPLFISSLSSGALFFTLLAPAITMNSFSTERQQGTLALLYSLPIHNWELVFGKFIAAWAMLMALVLASLCQPLTLYFVSDAGSWQLASGYLGLTLLAGFCAALGVFVSMLVPNTIAAYVISFALLALLQILSVLAYDSNAILDFIGRRIGLHARFSPFLQGEITLGNALYFIGGASLFLSSCINHIGHWRRHG